jgi:hypothetical protein
MTFPMNMEARRRLEEVGGRPQEARESLSTSIDGGGWNTSLLQSGNARQVLVLFKTKAGFCQIFVTPPQQKCKIFHRNK